MANLFSPRRARRNTKIFNTAIFALVATALIFAAAADGAQQYYYSIHFSSFKNLENANRQVNSLQEKGKMVFWKKTDVPGKGLYYRVYLGRYDKIDDAVAFWEKLNKIGAVGYFGIHRFNEKGELQNKISSAKISAPAKPQAELTSQIPPVISRFADNMDGTVTDTTTNLMWIKNGWRLDFFSAATWAEANNKCKKFNLGGYSDWRLPTKEEWRSIIDSNKKNPALVEPNPFENIIGHMPYWTQTEFTYSSKHTKSKKGPLDTYTVLLYSGTINHQKKSERAFILPVRSLN
ncbi:MAG: DUF1566 domain-containing protein [Desulfobacterales bacterium]|uniref:DUF1566 domain-containing protein n=1 Tax=Candidatus Desulfatibia vada TaxID=2841696 RepID=A0A8J6NV33_9BACT|nr:DUF1566 domain-containing protein [Candidatus Desulfatibia vada]